MAQERSFLDGIADNFAPVHRDGHKYIAIGAVLALLGFLVWSPLGWLAALGTIFLAIAFRDPDRVVPQRDGLFIAPSDGRVEAIESVTPDPAYELGDGERLRISIHLGLFNVHITRAPLAGRIMKAIYTPGAFGDPWREKAHEDNERRATVIETPDGVRIAVVQIAGGWRRRIVGFVKDGDRVGLGERIGMIRLGSRVDVYLPMGAVPLVAVGQTLVAGETTMADARSEEPERIARIV